MSDLKNEHADNLRLLVERATTAGASLVEQGAIMSAKIIDQANTIRALTRTVGNLTRTSNNYREALEEIVRLEKASPNVGIRLIAELALNGKISESPDDDR